MEGRKQPIHGKVPLELMNMSENLSRSSYCFESDKHPPHIISSLKPSTLSLIPQKIHDEQKKVGRSSSNAALVNHLVNNDSPQSVCTNRNEGVLIDSDQEPKNMKRILANRESARRSRIKKQEYVAHLEKTVDGLQEDVNSLVSQVSFHEQHHDCLKLESSTIKGIISSITNDDVVKDAHFQALMKEKGRLCKLYMQQMQLFKK